MRVDGFAEWLGESHARSGAYYDRGTARDYRVAKHNYRTEILLPAIREIRAQGRGAEAHNLEQAYGAVRDLPQETIFGGMGTHADNVNAELNAIAVAEGSAYPQCVGVALPTIQHSLLPTYDTPRGWMTRQAANSAGGQSDIDAIREVFERNYGGMRSAPVHGYPHFHVNGLASRVMSIAPPNLMQQTPMPPNRILAFTGHIDGSNPGQTQQGIVNTAVNDALSKGWVWVAIINDTLHRIVHS